MSFFSILFTIHIDYFLRCYQNFHKCNVIETINWLKNRSNEIFVFGLINSSFLKWQKKPPITLWILRAKFFFGFALLSSILYHIIQKPEKINPLNV